MVFGLSGMCRRKQNDVFLTSSSKKQVCLDQSIRYVLHTVDTGKKLVYTVFTIIIKHNFFSTVFSQIFM